jgi:hypothetical protein
MLFLLLGLRIAASLPGDVRSGWLFELREPARPYARRALERVMVLLGILPPALAAAPVYWWLWGRDVAIIHTAVVIALGMVIVAYLIWHCEGMPCGQRWALARASLGYRWPLYVAGFFLITVWIPRLELLLFDHVYVAGAFVAILIAIAAITRYAAARHVIVPSYDDVDPVAGVLRLN